MLPGCHRYTLSTFSNEKQINQTLMHPLVFYGEITQDIFIWIEQNL